MCMYVCVCVCIYVWYMSTSARDARTTWAVFYVYMYMLFHMYMYMSVYIHIYVYAQICGWAGDTRAVLGTRKGAAQLWICVFDVFIWLYKHICVNVYIYADLWVGGGHACRAWDARGSCARVDDRCVWCMHKCVWKWHYLISVCESVWFLYMRGSWR